MPVYNPGYWQREKRGHYLIDGQVETTWNLAPIANLYWKTSLPSLTLGLDYGSGYDNNGRQLPDEVFVGLRQSTNCFLPPRDCGSCYAFAMKDIAGWHFCMEAGKLVAFSEQYDRLR